MNLGLLAELIISITSKVSTFHSSLNYKDNVKRTFIHFRKLLIELIQKDKLTTTSRD